MENRAIINSDFENESIYVTNGESFSIHFIPDSCQLDYWKNLHYHNEYIEILYAYKGNFRLMLNGETFLLPKGSLFILNTGDLHATMRADTNTDSQLMCLKFMPSVLQGADALIPQFYTTTTFLFDNFGAKNYFSPEEISCSILPYEFNFLKIEYNKNDLCCALSLRSATMRIFGWIVRKWYNDSNNSTEAIFSSNTMENVHRIKRYLNENYSTATLKSTADACGLSYSYLSRKFPTYMNMNFNDYVNLIKINHSMENLSSTKETITNIAFAYGFSSASHYISTFKRLKNMTPKEFRKLSRNEKSN